MKNIREFFTPRCGAMFDENSVPLGQGGTSGGVERGNKPNPVLAPPSRWFDSAPTNTAHPTTPAVAVGPASPPRLRRGAYFQESIAAAVFPDQPAGMDRRLAAGDLGARFSRTE